MSNNGQVSVKRLKAAISRPRYIIISKCTRTHREHQDEPNSTRVCHGGDCPACLELRPSVEVRFYTVLNPKTPTHPFFLSVEADAPAVPILDKLCRTRKVSARYFSLIWVSGALHVVTGFAPELSPLESDVLSARISELTGLKIISESSSPHAPAKVPGSNNKSK